MLSHPREILTRVRACPLLQFITSSFQPELVQAADKHWLVTHSGMSRMVVGTLEDQLDIVRKNQQTAAEQQALQ
eukprot:91101-Rhodomonas_salina.1